MCPRNMLLVFRMTCRPLQRCLASWGASVTVVCEVNCPEFDLSDSEQRQVSKAAGKVKLTNALLCRGVLLHANTHMHSTGGSGPDGVITALSFNLQSTEKGRDRI